MEVAEKKPRGRKKKEDPPAAQQESPAEVEKKKTGRKKAAEKAEPETAASPVQPKQRGKRAVQVKKLIKLITKSAIT